MVQAESGRPQAYTPSGRRDRATRHGVGPQFNSLPISSPRICAMALEEHWNGAWRFREFLQLSRGGCLCMVSGSDHGGPASCPHDVSWASTDYLIGPVRVNTPVLSDLI
jgi:hypothetical protein